MSQPLAACTVARALDGNPEALVVMLARLSQPCFTFIPCRHDPKCKPADKDSAHKVITGLCETNPEAVEKLLTLASR